MLRSFFSHQILVPISEISILSPIQKEGSTLDDSETVIDGENDGENASVAPKTTTGRGFPKPVTEMTPEEKARADDIDLRCLSLCIGMLERVNGVRDSTMMCYAREVKHIC